ncbi:MAG TPA: XdhC family protein [Candidatus Limnocylindrales bacterium]|nr:XdhC family protein [Candidatus Limnocylindrales bacterium]
MRELLATYDAWVAEGLGVGRAVVVRTFGSAPRFEGAVLLVAEDGRLVGSVSGGCVEGAAAEEVARARATGRSRVIRYGISDEQAWGVGLACGGTIDVLAEPEVPEAVVGAVRRPGRAVVTPLPPDLPPPEVGPYEAGEGAAPGQAVVVDPAEPDGAGGADLPTGVRDAALADLDAGRSELVLSGDRGWFVEVFPTPQRLVAVGATEVTRQLVGLARALGYETIVVDARPAFATPERFPDVDRLLVAWPDEAFDEIGLGRRDAVAVLSHDPKFDEPAIVEAFRRGARYVGAVGSRRSQASRRDRLLAAGLTQADLSRLRGPIGLDLGGREPVETALAILAEIVAARRGGSGAPLRDRAGRISSPSA